MAHHDGADDEDPARELAREVVLAARARRRLLEHELTRRRTLLVLTVVLALATVALVGVLVGTSRGAVGATALVSAVWVGVATVRRERGPRL